VTYLKVLSHQFLVWLKVVWLARAKKEKNRKRFKNFPQLLRLLINVNRKAALQRKGLLIAFCQ
jgi:hypothetical protein